MGFEEHRELFKKREKSFVPRPPIDTARLQAYNGVAHKTHRDRFQTNTINYYVGALGFSRSSCLAGIQPLVHPELVDMLVDLSEKEQEPYVAPDVQGGSVTSYGVERLLDMENVQHGSHGSLLLLEPNRGIDTVVSVKSFGSGSVEIQDIDYQRLKELDNQLKGEWGVPIVFTDGSASKFTSTGYNLLRDYPEVVGAYNDGGIVRIEGTNTDELGGIIREELLARYDAQDVPYRGDQVFDDLTEFFEDPDCPEDIFSDIADGEISNLA